MSVTTDLTKKYVEPIILTEMDIDVAVDVVETFSEIGTWEDYGFVKNVAISTEQHVSGTTSLKFNQRSPHGLIDSINDITRWEAHGDASNVIFTSSNFTQGNGCISYDKTGATVTWSGLKAVDPTEFYWLKHAGLIAVDFYIPDAATLAKLSNLRMYFASSGASNRTDKTVMYVGWNTVVYDLSAPTTAVGTLDWENLTQVSFEFSAAASANTFSGVLIDNFRVYDGPTSHITDVIEACDDYTEWAGSTDASGLADDTLGVKFSKDGTTELWGGITKTANYDVSRGGCHAIDFYIPAADLAVIAAARVGYITASGGSYGISNDVVAGWNTMYFTPQVGMYSNNANGLGLITIIQLRLYTYATSDTFTDCIIGNLRYTPEANKYDLDLGRILVANWPADDAYTDTIAQQTLITSYGVNSVSFNKLTGSTGCGIVSDVGAKLDISLATLIAYDFYIPAGYAQHLVYIALRMDSGSDGSGNNYQWNQYSNWVDGWNTIYINVRAPYSTAGTFVKENVASITIRPNWDDAGRTPEGMRINNLRHVRTRYYDSGYLGNGDFRNWKSTPTESPNSWAAGTAGLGTQRQGSIKKSGRQSLKISYPFVSDYDGNFYQTITKYVKFKGATITLEAWGYSTTANTLRLKVDDGITQTTGSYHSGSGEWEKLTLTVSVNTVATKLLCGCCVTAGASYYAYIDEFHLSIGTEVKRNLVLDSFDDITEWRVRATWAQGTLSADTTNYTRGKQGITFTKGTTSVYGPVIYRDCSFKLSQFKAIAVDIYIKDATALAKLAAAVAIRIFLSLDGTRTNYYEAQIAASDLHTGYNTFAVNILDFTVAAKNNAQYATSSVNNIELYTQTVNDTDTFAAGDITFSNLRLLDREPFESLTDWDGSSVDGWEAYNIDNTAPVAVSTPTKSGLGAVTFSKDGTAASIAGIKKTGLWDFSNGFATEVWFNLSVADAAKLTSAYILLQDGTLYSGFNQRTNFKEGWNRVDFNAFVEGTGNGANLAYITEVDLCLLTSAAAETLTDVAIDFFHKKNHRMCIYDHDTDPGYTNDAGAAGAISVETSNFYSGNACLKFTKTGTGNILVGFACNVDIDISPKYYRTIYIPVYTPAADYDVLEASNHCIRWHMDISTSWANYRTWYTYRSELVRGGWAIVKIDIDNPDTTTGSPNDLGVEFFGFRIITAAATDTLSGMLIDGQYTELHKFNQNGIKDTDFNKGLDIEPYVRYNIYISSQESVDKIKGLWLILDSSRDYSETNFYFNSDALTVGWNEISVTLSSPTMVAGAATLNIQNAYIIIETYNNLETIDDIYIDKLATYNTTLDTFRYSNTEIIGIINNKHWEGRLLKIGKITRSISEKKGLFTVSNASVDLIDTDRFFTNLYHNIGGAGGFKNKDFSLKFGTQGNPESEFLPVYSGRIENLSLDNLVARFSINDISKQYFNRLPRVLLTVDDFSDLPDGMVSQPAPLIYGAVTSDTGAIPCEYIGKYGTYYYYMVAGHVCKSGTGTVYLKDSDDIYTTPSTGFTIDYNLIVNGKSFTVIKVDEKYSVASINITAGGTGYKGGDLVFDNSGGGQGAEGTYQVTAGVIDNTYVRKGGDSYPVGGPTSVYTSHLGNSDATLAAVMEVHNPWEDYDVSISISGKTIDGTVTGTLLTDSVDIIEDLLVNEIGIPSALIDTTSFATVQTYVNQRNQSIAGAVIKDDKAENVVADMLMSQNIEMYPTNDGKIALNIFIPEKADNTAPLYTDEVDIFSGTFELITGTDNIINRVRYRLQFNYVTDKWEASNEVLNQVSIDRAGQIYDWAGGYLDMKWTRTASVAAQVAQRHLDKYKQGRPGAKLTVPMTAISNELAGKIRITHFQGTARAEDQDADLYGWNNQLCRINSMSIDVDKNMIAMEVDNLQDLASSCNYLGDRDGDTVPAFSKYYNDASETEQEYMYLPDRSTGQFGPPSNDDGHKLC